MSDLGLGKIITGPQQRDAIHVAVVPVTAGERLEPGQHVGFVDKGDNYTVGAAAQNIGVVDPFLRELVAKGERFWLFLYPNTVTSLRHEWTHPAFDKVDWRAWDNGAVVQLANLIREHKQYDHLPGLVTALEKSGCDDEKVLKRARDALGCSVIGSGGPGAWRSLAIRAACLVIGGRKAEAVYGIDELADELGQTVNELMGAADQWAETGDYTNMGNDERYKDVPSTRWDEFWDDYESVTGNVVAEKCSFFSCAC